MLQQGQNGLQKAVHILMLLLFLPMLFCVLFIGNGMNYFEELKPDLLVPSAVLTLIALAVFAFCLWLIKKGQKIPFTARMSRYVDLALVLLSIGLYFFCLVLSRETMFDMSVDQGVVRETAKEVAHGVPLGYRYELSIYHNNLPIIYILGRLYRMAEGWTWFSHDPEYLWIIVGCLLVTVAGFCCCEIVKKLTRNPVAVLLSFGIYLVTAGLSPWKYIPYTDSYAILPPVLCILLYLYSRDCKNMAAKALLMFLAMAAGVMGSLVKPSCLIAVLAVLGAEGLHLITDVIERCKKKAPDAKGIVSSGILLLAGVISTGIWYGGTKLYQNYIIKDMGFEINEDLGVNAPYYFFIGTNELTTGSFTIDDFGVFGEFQSDREGRNAACMERAWERIRERGPVGTAYFCLRKLAKSFNDGTFAWTDTRYYQPFPEDFTHDNRVAGYLRSLFLPGGANQNKYDTLAKLAWNFILMGIPWFALGRDRKNFYAVFSILLIGILVYLMLFESGARYIFLFLPVFVAMSVCGMDAAESILFRRRGCDRA